MKERSTREQLQRLTEYAHGTQYIPYAVYDSGTVKFCFLHQAQYPSPSMPRHDFDAAYAWLSGYKQAQSDAAPTTSITLPDSGNVATFTPGVGA